MNFSQQIFDADCVVLETTANGTIIHSSPSVTKLTGLPKEHFLSKKFEEIIEKSGRFYYLSTKSGKRLVLQGFYIQDEDGSIFVGKDITQLYDTKNRFALEKTFLTHIFNATNNMIVIRKNFRFFRANKKFYKTLGFKNSKDFLAKHRGIQELFEPIEGYFYTDERNWEEKIEDKELKVSIRSRIYQLYVRHFTIQNDYYSITTLHDITDIEQAKQQAIQAEKLKTQFLANLVHDIRGALNSIIGFTDLLTQTKLDIKQSQYLLNIKTSTDFLYDLANDILDFSKLESNKMQLNVKCTNLFYLFSSLFKSLQPIAKEKELDFQIALSLDNECYEVDEARLKQVVMNLLNNALKFTKKGFVRLEVDRNLTINVIDSGPGIEKEKQQAIFEAYLQAKPTDSGTGLGLAISSKLVKLMGSTLKLESKVGKGSRFYFQLNAKPCKGKELKTAIPSVFVDKEIKDRLEPFLKYLGIKIKPDAPVTIGMDESSTITLYPNDPYLIYTAYVKLYDVMQKQSEEEKILFPNKRVLVADDYELNRQLLGELFKRFNLEVDLVHNGKKAVEAVQEKGYDLILMDYTMPVMNGEEAAKIIKGLGIKTPIVALTGYDNIKKGELFDDILIKPIKTQELLELLKRYLNPKVEYIIKKYDLSPQEGEELWQYFQTNIQKSLNNLKTAITKKDYETLYKEFHNIKSTAAYFGYEKASQIAKKYMDLAREKRKIDYENGVKMIEKEIKF